VARLEQLAITEPTVRPILRYKQLRRQIKKVGAIVAAIRGKRIYPRFVLGSVEQAPPKNSVVGPRGNGFSLGKDGEAGDIGFIVDARLRRRCSQADNSGCLYPTVTVSAA